VAHGNPQAGCQGLPETRTESHVIIINDFLGASVVTNHVVDEMDGCLLGGVYGTCGDEAAHAGQTVDKREDAVSFEAAVHGGGGSHRPVHLEMLPREIRRAQQLCVVPG
jgi:hypothetical protein